MCLNRVAEHNLRLQVAQLEDQLLHLNGLVTAARDRQAEAEKQMRLQKGVATELQSQVTIRDREITRLTETVCYRYTLVRSGITDLYQRMSSRSSDSYEYIQYSFR